MYLFGLAGGLIYTVKRGYYTMNQDEHVSGGYPSSEGTTSAARYVEIIVEAVRSCGTFRGK